MKHWININPNIHKNEVKYVPRGRSYAYNTLTTPPRVPRDPKCVYVINENQIFHEIYNIYEAITSVVFWYKLPSDRVQDQQLRLPWTCSVHIQPVSHRSPGVQLVLLSQGRLQCAYFRYIYYDPYDESHEEYNGNIILMRPGSSPWPPPRPRQQAGSPRGRRCRRCGQSGGWWPAGRDQTPPAVGRAVSDVTIITNKTTRSVCGTLPSL